MSGHKKKEQQKKIPAASTATLRDYFAQAALLSLTHATIADEGQCCDVATRAYLLADAMLLARGDPPSEEVVEAHDAAVEGRQEETK